MKLTQVMSAGGWFVATSRLVLAAAGLILVAGLILANAPLTAAQSSGGIGGRPASPKADNPRSQSIFIFSAQPDEVKQDAILISNDSDQAQEIEIYAVDGIVTNTGTYTCEQLSEEKDSVGSWIELEKSKVKLEAGVSKEVGFRLTIPADAEVGEHNGCIVFQPAIDDSEVSGNVRIRTRQAIRVAATVPGDLKRDVIISQFDTTHENGTQVYTLNLKNNGNVSADVDAKVQLRSLLGRVVYENGGGYPILANQKLDLRFIDEKPPFFGGWYKASASVAYDKRAGTFGTTTGENLITKQSDPQTVFIAPTAAGAILLVMLLLGLIAAAWWFVRRRHAQKNALKTWQTYTVQPGDSIENIAGRYGISWKQLASINHLGAPYTLEPNQQLRVPARSTETDSHKDAPAA